MERSVRATHHFLSEDDIVALRPLVGEALGGGALELWVLVGDDDVPGGFMGLDGDDISALFLEPAWRGRGGGRRLVAHAQSLRGCALTMHVNEQNPEAVGFQRAMKRRPYMPRIPACKGLFSGRPTIFGRARAHRCEPPAQLPAPSTATGRSSTSAGNV